MIITSIERGAAWRIALLRQTTSCLYGLNFDCTTSSDTFNCTNNFFDPYLTIHHTTFMALRFVIKAVCSLEIPMQGVPRSKFV